MHAKFFLHFLTWLSWCTICSPQELGFKSFYIMCTCVYGKRLNLPHFPPCLIFKVEQIEFSYVLMLNSVMVVWCPWAAFTKFIMRRRSGCVTVWEGSDGLRHLINPELLEDQCRSSSLFVCVWRSSLYRLQVWCPIKEASQTSDQSLRNRKWDSRDTQDIHH